MEDLSSVLSFCNDVRQFLGRQPVSKLRKGEPQEPQGCPIANTINFGARNRVYVDAATVDMGDELTLIAETTPAVNNFIFAFDEWLLPEFVGKGWAE